jgi:hypothetical protein
MGCGDAVTQIVLAVLLTFVLDLVAHHLQQNGEAVANRAVRRVSLLVHPSIRALHTEAALADIAYCKDVGKSPLAVGAAAVLRLLEVALRLRTIVEPITVEWEPGSWHYPPGVRLSVRHVPERRRSLAWQRAWDRQIYAETFPGLRPHHEFWIKSWPTRGEAPSQTAQRLSAQLRRSGVVVDSSFEPAMIRALESHADHETMYRRFGLWDQNGHAIVLADGDGHKDHLGRPLRQPVPIPSRASTLVRLIVRAKDAARKH